LFNLNFNYSFNHTYIFPNQHQLKVLFIKQLFSNHNHNSYRNTKHTRDGINVVANNNKAMCLVDLRDFSYSIKVLKSSIGRALNETIAVNLCSMYELTCITHLDTNSMLSNWIGRVAPNDFDSSFIMV
jgi:hypothetical protein